MSHTFPEKCLAFLLGLCLITPLIFLRTLYAPFLSTKIFFFVFLIELSLPFFVFHLSRLPERRSILTHPIPLSLLLYFCLMSLSASVGVDPWNSFLGNASRVDGLFLRYHLFIFFLALVTLFQTWKSSRIVLVRLFLCVGMLVGTIGALQHLNLLPSIDVFETRSSSTIGNPVFFAASLMIPFFLSIGMFVREKTRLWRSIFAICALTTGLGILASETRGAYLGVLIGCVTWGVISLVTHTQKAQRRKTWLCLVLGCLLLSVVGLSLRYTSTQGTDLYRLTHYTDASVSSRLTYWRLAVIGWMDDPWFGVGHQNFYRIADRYYPNDLYEESGSWPDKPHNQILEILATGGIFTLLSYLLYLFVITRTILKRKSQDSWIPPCALMSALVAYLVQNLFVFNTIVPLVSFYFFLALVFDAPIPPQQHIRSGTLWRWIRPLSLVVPLIIIFFLLIPTASQFSLYGQVISRDHESPQQQVEHLDRVSQAFFVYDIALLADLYSDTLEQQIKGNIQDPGLTTAIYSSAHQAYEKTLRRHPVRAYNWYRAARLELSYAVATNTPVSQESFAIVSRAIELAPTRVEALIVLSNMQTVNGLRDEAEKTIQAALVLAPNHPDALFTLALIYARDGDLSRAAPLAIQSLQQGEQLTSAQAFDWLINYYIGVGDTPKIVFLYESARAVEPNNDALLPKLAAAYAADGRIQQAIETAVQYRTLHPESAQEVNAFIETLK